MNLKLLKLVIFIISFVLLSPVKGFSFAVTAQVDRNSISINDSIVLSVILEDGEGEVDISAITDFTIVSQSSQSNISIINGKYSKSVTSIYSLIPKKAGTLKIPHLKVAYDNKIYTTREITIEVAEQSTTHRDNGSKDIFVEAGISGTSLFTGQQAVYQLRFYSAIKLSNASLQPPSFKGFTAKEAGERKSYTETINGRPYYVTEINYVIIPEITGAIEISPAVIICEVPVRKNSRSHFPDPFDDPFFSNNGFFSFGRSETRQFSTEPIMVQVENLPQYSGSTTFSGLVGDFSIDASLDNNNLKTGDSATLTITISGKGNIMDAKAPSVLIPPEFKVYDDSPEETIQLSIEGYSGKKTFKKAIVPVKSGKYTIEPVVLSFFNVSTHKYETTSTSKIAIEVKTSPDQQDNVENTPNTNLNQTSKQEGEISNNKKVVKKRQVELTGKDILSIKEDKSILEDRKEISLPMFLMLFFSPWLIYSIFIIVVSLSKKSVTISEVMSKKAKINLKDAMNCLKAQTSEIEHLKSEKTKAKNGTAKNGTTKNETAEKIKNGATEEGLNDKNDFFKHLHDALVAMVISKSELKIKAINGNDNSLTENFLDRPTKNYYTIPVITEDEVTKILTDAGSDPIVAKEVTAILSEIESARYGRQQNDLDYHHKLLKRVENLFKTLAGMVVVFIPFSINSFISLWLFSILALSAYPDKVYAGEIENSKSRAAEVQNVEEQNVRTHNNENQNIKADNFKNETLFIEGVKAYHNGDFLTAAEKFSAIVQGDNIQNMDNSSKEQHKLNKLNGIKNPYLYYNIGNAFIKAGDVGRAILWYERAKKEIPLDPDLRFNLEYAKGFVIDKIESRDYSSKEDGNLNTDIEIAELVFFWKDYFPPKAVKFGAISLSFIFAIYSGIRRFYKKRIFTPAGVAIFSSLIIAGCTSFYFYYNTYFNHYAVVVSKEASVRSGNSKDATQLFLLHSGTKVRIEEIQGEYLKIFFAKNKIGWISREDAEKI